MKRQVLPDAEVGLTFYISDFEENAVGLISFPMPRITCAKAYVGRERFVTAFEKYYACHGPDTGSHFIQHVNRTSDDYKLSNSDRARFDTINGHAMLANTTPTAFWTMFHILCDQQILAEVRAAAMSILTIQKQNGKLIREIDISNIREMPILKSILHECLRHYASGTGARIVVEDTLLDDRYLLKKGSFIFMPNQSYHFDPSAWGPTVNEFDAHRFIKSQDQKPHHPGAFRGFGGGANLCPGRFFAMNEILSLCAMVALQYDITPVTGAWSHPGADDSNMSLIAHPPKQKVWVHVAPRRDWSDGSWRFKI